MIKVFIHIFFTSIRVTFSDWMQWGWRNVHEMYRCKFHKMCIAIEVDRAQCCAHCFLTFFFFFSLSFCPSLFLFLLLLDEHFFLLVGFLVVKICYVISTKLDCCMYLFINSKFRFKWRENEIPQIHGKNFIIARKIDFIGIFNLSYWK